MCIQYTLYVRCTVYYVYCGTINYCTLYTVQCTVYCVKNCAPPFKYNSNRWLWKNIRRTLHIVHSKPFRVSRTLYAVYCTVYSIHIIIYTVTSWIYDLFITWIKIMQLLLLARINIQSATSVSRATTIP